MKITKKLLITGLMGLAVSSFSGLAHNHGDDGGSDLKSLVQQAQNADGRPERDAKRDRNRKPAETLAFFGLEPDMKVVELMPGGGWYTRILAPVLHEKGGYYVALGTSRVEKNLIGQAPFDQINVVAKDAKIWREKGAKLYSLEMSNFGVTDADMVLTFRNYHNFGEEGRKAMNDAAFKALKSGGIYGVVDHTARHMEPFNDSNRRRFDPVKAILEIQAAGFEFVGFSNLHYREDDELEYEVGARSVTGNTDRWTLKFKKP
ncbi:MAG: methyltransferase [Alteromonadaceae bacterium]|nr:methyltransferase [Alteromonadaceae bacterium]